MDLNKEAYKKEVKRRAPKSPTLKNCCFAFLIGGGICVLGNYQCFHDLLPFPTEARS